MIKFRGTDKIGNGIQTKDILLPPNRDRVVLEPVIRMSPDNIISTFIFGNILKVRTEHQAFSATKIRLKCKQMGSIGWIRVNRKIPIIQIW